MDGIPAGTISACHPSGWIQMDMFTKWFDHFVHCFKSAADDSVLLIVDGHYSHIKNLNVVDKATEHGVTIISLPPHIKLYAPCVLCIRTGISLLSRERFLYI